MTFLVAIYTYNRAFTEAFWLLVLWISIFAARPLERGYEFARRTWRLWDSRAGAEEIGTLLGRSQPGILTIEVTNLSNANRSHVVCVLEDEGRHEVALVIDRYFLAGTHWLRALKILERMPALAASGLQWEPGTVVAYPEESLSKGLLESEIYNSREKLFGIVVENSNLQAVSVELLKENCDLGEGQLLETDIQGRRVLYQIVGAETQSELLQGKDRHGFLRLRARKLGIWNREEGVFQQVEWVPDIYTPVFRIDTCKTCFNDRFIGYVPNTAFGIQVNCSELVTHNTAILGVLGSGKSYLAFELIDRMVEDGIRCIVIDITGEYALHMPHRIDADSQEDGDARIVSAIEKTATRVDDNQSTGGNHPDFRKAILESIREFMTQDNPEIRIYNPLKYNVTYQSRGAYRGEAAFDEMTPCQITGLIAEALFEYAKDTMTPQARICLVLEEAHSLVPEWNSVINDREKEATMRTVRAVLQGRKYGLGCMLITQRTANVTKSILNQCNTIFALQTFDATGMDFLANYVGSDYTAVLSTLKPRTCVAYGKGLNSRVPVIMGINDRDDFINNRRSQ